LIETNFSTFMKISKSKFLVIVSLWLTATSIHAQSYSIDWHKIAGGGGTSSNGQYSVSGTIGQHDAGGPMTGGNYSLTGGFWALFAVQTQGAPLLSITRTPTNSVLISWPSPSTGFVLQQNANLTTSNWVTVPQTPVDNGTNVTANKTVNSVSQVQIAMSSSAASSGHFFAVHRQPHFEPGFSGARFEFNFTAMTVGHDTVADDQAEAGARADRLGCKEGLEHV
jgi:hypothetical protein